MQEAKYLRLSALYRSEDELVVPSDALKAVVCGQGRPFASWLDNCGPAICCERPLLRIYLVEPDGEA